MQLRAIFLDSQGWQEKKKKGSNSMLVWTSQMVCSVMEGSKAGMQSSMFRLLALLKPRPDLQSRKELEFLGEKSKYFKYYDHFPGMQSKRARSI